MMTAVIFTITSFWFFAFLAITLLVYYLLPKRIQWVWLLAASFGFIYLYVGFSAFLFLLIDIGAIYAGSQLIDNTKKLTSRRWLLAATLFIIVGQLFLLRYYNNMAGWIGRFLDIQSPVWRCSWIAPVGISYFSLSAVGYVLDVYWKTYHAERNPLKIALLVSWFPALVSGPIVRFNEQSEYLFSEHEFSYLSLKFGLERMLWGLFKKMVIADRLAMATAPIFAAPMTYGGLCTIFAVGLFAFQIYTDFSGCMDIVLGASEMFQITLPENFKRPFFSKNLSEFWRRWHITLGIWAKDYVMYPLLKSEAFQNLGSICKKKFGKKFGKTIPTYIGMLVLWLIIGIWHGGSAKYIFAAGILPWILIVGGQLLQPMFRWIVHVLRIRTDCFGYKLFSSLRTLLLMCLIWLFATAPNVVSVFDILRSPMASFSLSSLRALDFNLLDFKLVSACFVVVLAASILQEKGIPIRKTLERQKLVIQWIVLLLGIFVVLIFGIYGPGYDPADFIYAGF